MAHCTKSARIHHPSISFSISVGDIAATTPRLMIRWSIRSRTGFYHSNHEFVDSVGHRLPSSAGASPVGGQSTKSLESFWRTSERGQSSGELCRLHHESPMPRPPRYGHRVGCKPLTRQAKRMRVLPESGMPGTVPSQWQKPKKNRTISPIRTRCAGGASRMRVCRLTSGRKGLPIPAASADAIERQSPSSI